MANGTNMLSDPAGPLYDTIKDLNLSEDKIGLSFIVNNVVDLGTYGGVGSLQDAVQTLFDNSGPLNEVANAAGTGVTPIWSRLETPQAPLTRVM